MFQPRVTVRCVFQGEGGKGAKWTWESKTTGQVGLTTVLPETLHEWEKLWRSSLAIFNSVFINLACRFAPPVNTDWWLYCGSCWMVVNYHHCCGFCRLNTSGTCTWFYLRKNCCPDSHASSWRSQGSCTMRSSQMQIGPIAPCWHIFAWPPRTLSGPGPSFWALFTFLSTSLTAAFQHPECLPFLREALLSFSHAAAVAWNALPPPNFTPSVSSWLTFTHP